MAKNNRDKYIDAANKYLQKQQYDKAIKEYEKAYNEDPKNASVALKLGQLYEKVKKPQDSIKYLKIAASLYSKSGFHNRAIPVYTQILNIDPTQIDIYLELAEQCAKMGILVRAVENYRIALKAYEEKGDNEKALDILRKLVEIDPKNSDNRIKLAEYYFKTGHRDKGYLEFRRAAEDLKADQRWDELIKLYDKLIKADPTNPENYHGLGEALMERGEIERAFQAYHQILKYRPDDADAMEKIIVVSIRLKDIQNAVNYLKTLADKAEKKGDKDSAIKYLQRAYKLQPDPELKAKLGPLADKVPPAPPVTSKAEELPLQEADTIEEEEITALEPAPVFEAPEEAKPEETSLPEMPIDDLPLAEKAGQRAAEQELPPPTADQLLSIFGEVDVYLQYDLVSKAEQLVARVLKAFPDNYDALRLAGKVYHRKGDYAKAINYLLSAVKSAKKVEAYDDARRFAEEILEIDPSNSQAQAIIAELDAGEEISIGIDEEEPPAPAPAPLSTLNVGESEVLTLEDAEDMPALEETALEEANLEMAPQEELEPFSFVEEKGGGDLELEEEAKPASVEEPILGIEGESFGLTDATSSEERVEEDLTLGLDEGEVEAPSFELEEDISASVEEEVIEEMELHSEPEELIPPSNAKAQKAPLSKEEQIKALMNEAEVYHQQGFVKEALATLGRIIAMAPDYLPALEKLQQIKLDQTILKPTTPVLEEIEELEVEEPTPEPAPLSAVAEGAEEVLDLLHEEEEELEIPAEALEEVELESAEEEGSELDEAMVDAAPSKEEEPPTATVEEEEPVQMEAVEEVASQTQPPPEPEVEALDAVEQDMVMEEETVPVEMETEPAPADQAPSLNLDEEWEDEEEILEDVPPSSHIEEIAEASEDAWSSALESEQEEAPPQHSPEVQAQLDGMDEAAEEAFGMAFGEEKEEVAREELETFKDLDLSSALEESKEPPLATSAGEVEFDDVSSIVAACRDKVHKQIGEDIGAYFDLGIAYKEMGLLDDAISSFRSALKGGVNPTECLHMIALCFMDKGELNKAEAVLREGLKEENLRDEEKMILEYELGVVLEEEGRLNEALELLKDVQRMKKDFRDVRSIIIRLEERIGVAEPSKPSPFLGKDKISYI